MARPSRLTSEQKAEIVGLYRAGGTTYKALAAKYNVSTQTIIRICRPDYYERAMKSNREYQLRNQAQIFEQRKEHYRRYSLAFHIEYDSDIISFLDQQGNIHDYIRQKVLADMQEKK